jgi:hypothetical protein
MRVSSDKYKQLQVAVMAMVSTHQHLVDRTCTSDLIALVENVANDELQDSYTLTKSEVMALRLLLYFFQLYVAPDENHSEIICFTVIQFVPSIGNRWLLYSDALQLIKDRYPINGHAMSEERKEDRYVDLLGQHFSSLKDFFE